MVKLSEPLWKCFLVLFFFWHLFFSSANMVHDGCKPFIHPDLLLLPLSDSINKTSQPHPTRDYSAHNCSYCEGYFNPWMRRYGANETDAGFTDRIITDLFLCRKVKKTKAKTVTVKIHWERTQQRPDAGDVYRCRKYIDTRTLGQSRHPWEHSWTRCT